MMSPQHESSPVAWISLVGFLIIIIALVWPLQP